MYRYTMRVLACLAILLPVWGCSSPGSDLPSLTAPKAVSYRLGAGDKVDLKVLGADELTGQYIVQDDGTVRLLMIGAVPASGITPDELAGMISDRLKEGRYISHPQVSASVVVYRPFYILGEVARPGGYPYASGMRVLSAIAAAQGYTYRANQDYVIVTRNGKESRANTLASIRPDDIIRVPERYF